MAELESLCGIVEKLIYHNQENGFAVFIVQTSSRQNITVKGYVSAVTPGEQVSILGTWNMHEKFGKQFDAKSCQTQAPTSIVGLKKYLGSGLIKGIGPVYAEKLVNHFGEKILEIFDTAPERLLQVPGIGQHRVKKIVDAWADQKEISNIMVFLQSKGLSSLYAVKIYKFYKEKAIAIIEENPYRLAQDIWGIGFKTADTIAQKSGIAANSSKRIAAAIIHLIQDASSDGHLYVLLDELKKKVATLLELNFDDIVGIVKIALHDLYNADKIKLITHADIHYITVPPLYYSEKGIAFLLQKIVTAPSRFACDSNEMKALLNNQNDQAKVVLNDEQKDGILTCLHNKVTVITGGPGTGKTTLIKSLLDLLDKSGLKYLLAAPTGRAAKRITEGTGRPASTIHRLLDFNVSTMKFMHNEQNALATDLLIIDESSMIDVFLAHSILKALPIDAHIVFIGDTDQLPSVGAGNFLYDIIGSGVIPTIRLKHIFRQAQNSMIILNAHRINNGEFPTMNHENARKDFIFIKEDNPENLSAHLTTIYEKGLPRYHIRPGEAIVLAPMHRGIAGTQKLNHDLQNMLNNDSVHVENQLIFAGSCYRVNDRVMQLRNNYDKNVFNGDIGFIESINKEDKIIHIRFLDKLVEYEASDLNELVHGYAISIHKSQGSEFAAVIVPVFMQHFMMLQKNLLYTAITRAKKLCIFIGQSRAISMGIKNNKNSNRLTFLQHYLTTDLQCR